MTNVLHSNNPAGLIRESRSIMCKVSNSLPYLVRGKEMNDPAQQYYRAQNLNMALNDTQC